MYIKLFLILSGCILNSEQLKLQKVLILSRHNIRTPLSKTLAQFSPKSWPLWSEKLGFLTAKGTLLEGYMGTYFSEWLREEKLLQEGCPKEKDLFVYANNFQRTEASAKAFVDSAFPSCKIDIQTEYSRNNTDKTKHDPLFNPFIHNKSAEYKTKVISEMGNEIKHLQLSEQLKQLEEILDYEHSENCIKNHECSLISANNRPFVKTNSQPGIIGPLKIGKCVIDAFLMAYYEGLENVAWGELRTEEKWSSILDIYHNYQSVLFNSTSNDISRPLIKYIRKLLNNDIKVTLLVGHDTNIYTVLKGIGCKPYTLEKQKEVTPIGGKVVFQKWSDDSNDFLKIDYVYQSSKDIREGKQINLLAPPMIQQLELKDCGKLENGLCLWNDFEKVLEKLVNSQ